MNNRKKLKFLAVADIHGKRSVFKGLAHHARHKNIDLVILVG